MLLALSELLSLVVISMSIMGYHGLPGLLLEGYYKNEYKSFMRDASY